MNTPQRKRFPVFLIVLAIAAMAGGIWASMQINRMDAQPVASPVTAITVFPTQRSLEPVSLIDQEGEAFDLTGFRGHWSLVFLGFTNCGHVCPMTMARLRMIHDGIEKPLNMVFVSVDPNRDTPKAIRAYIRNYDDRFTGLTGDPTELDKLANSLGAPYFVDTNPDNYIVDHSSALFLIDPSASLAGVISQPMDIEKVTQELNELL